MQMAEDWANYWKISDETDHGGIIFWIRTEDEATAVEHLPTDNNRSSGSLAISNNKTFRWSRNNKMWEEM